MKLSMLLATLCLLISYTETQAISTGIAIGAPSDTDHIALEHDVDINTPSHNGKFLENFHARKPLQTDTQQALLADCQKEEADQPINLKCCAPPKGQSKERCCDNRPSSMAHEGRSVSWSLKNPFPGGICDFLEHFILRSAITMVSMQVSRMRGEGFPDRFGFVTLIAGNLFYGRFEGFTLSTCQTILGKMCQRG